MIEMKAVSLTYPNGAQALSDIDVSIQSGEFVFLVGPTGSGKSSFLRLINREEIPTSGKILVDSQDLSILKRSKVPLLRRKIGVIFQDFKLLLQKTVYENVAYALEVIGTPRYEIARWVNRTLSMVGLGEKAHHFPGELSGGEQQRISIARALVNNPVILLADEPTGNLDPETSWDIMQLLAQVNQKGTTLLVATHNKNIVDTMRKRVIGLAEGRMTCDQEKGAYSLAKADSAAGGCP
ncbi:MAG: cell division ATP-binding protein FtsE [bacterium]